MKRILQNIWHGDGDEPRHRDRSCSAGEDGMIVLVTLVAVIVFLILIALVANAGKIVSQKMEVQNGTDSLTYSSALVMARGMNGVTGANHAMGELTALVVLHHALGGDELDNARSPTPDSKDGSILDALNTGYRLADDMKDQTFHPNGATYDLVKDVPQAGATLYRSSVRLQQVLGWTYQTLAFGESLWQARDIPFVGPIFAATGGTISTAAMFVEKKIWFERLILNGLHKIASASETLRIKRGIQEDFIPLLYNYSEQLHFQTGQAITDVVKDQQSANVLAETAVDPDPSHPLFRLPLRTEDASEASLQVSQLTRATYPWVNHWRQPMLEAMQDWLLLARSAHYYRHYTDLYTYQKVHELKLSGKQLYVLKGYHPLAKGTELWTTSNGSQLADDLFCLTGFGLREAPTRFAPTIYRDENPDGVMGYAQAMFYNANPQHRSLGLGPSQADVGWDTLNWHAQVPEIDSPEQVGRYELGNWDRWSPENVTRNDYPSPAIRLNWQAKLVPVSKLHRLNDTPSGRVGKILERLEVSQSQFRTH